MATTSRRLAYDDPTVRDAIMRMRQVDNTTNLGYLAVEYIGLVLTIGLAVVFAEGRSSWGLAWGWNVPVFVLAVMVIGAIQHRLAGLGHEASHYTFLRNKFANDLVADLFCMFPVLTSVHLYRLFHMAHHQYTNDPEHDPDLVSMGRSKKVDEFPMPRWRFVALYYLRLLVAPLSFLRYQGDYLYVNTLGKGNNVYMKRVPDGDGASRWPRPGTVLGLTTILGLSVGLAALERAGQASWMLPLTALVLAIGALAIAVMPASWMFRSPFRQPYGTRFASLLRLSYYVGLLWGLAELRHVTEGRSVAYVVLLWLVPMGTTFMFYMLLRDVYQHANADRGRLTNSRVFFTGPLTRWAVFVYGQDIHVTHHLFPAIPHHHLPDLHRLLRESDPEYDALVVECHGTFHGKEGRPAILDELTRPKAPAR